MIQPSIIAALTRHALSTPDAPALQGAHVTLTYAELLQTIEKQAAGFVHEQGQVMGMLMENSPAWAVMDLMAMQQEIPLVPIPGFFSSAQIVHAIRDAGIAQLICDQPIVVGALLEAHSISILAKHNFQVAGKWLTQFTLQVQDAKRLPAHTAKVTYTSGTTGNPKGVCLSVTSIAQVAHSLLQVTAATASDRHLSVLPLSTLLENIAGLYVPLLAGASTTLLPSSEVGLSGASGFNPAAMLDLAGSTRASTLVLTPELLKGLVMMAEAGARIPQGLRFIAVGGAAVSPSLLQRAAKVGLPVYEGYGLSECTSVVAVNNPVANKIGSVGKPLPHVQVRMAADGEILVTGSTMLAYSGETESDYGNRYLPTGDIGYLDEAGFLHISGRKKNVFITSFGRNVSPEWVESQLTQSPCIMQAVLFGEAKPWNTALIVPARGATSEQIDQVVNEINAGLPDYARVRHWLYADTSFSLQNLQMTANNRPRRDVIWQAYQTRINHLYEESYAVL